MKDIRSTTTVVVVLAAAFAHVVLAATAAPRTATTTQKVSSGRQAPAHKLRGGGGNQRRCSENLLRSRKLRRHDVDNNDPSHPIDRQYMVFLKAPPAEEEGRRNDGTTRRSSWTERWSDRRVLHHTNDNSNNDGPLRAVTLQGLTDQDLLDLIDDDEVAFVEQDQYVSLVASSSSSSRMLSASSSTSTSTTAPPDVLSWGLDRLDQPFPTPLDGRFRSRYTGRGVDVYVLDSGLLQSHPEFRQPPDNGTFCSFNALPMANYHNETKTSNAATAADDHDCSDTTGHGTHVSSIIAGQTTGVAPDVNLHMVKVVNETGSGPLSATILGIQHVIQKQIDASRNAATNRTFVLNISLGSIKSDAFVYAVELAVHYGVFVVMAAGNEAGTACPWTSGRAVSALTVGATTRDDRIAHFSNYGSCVDLFAPGDEIPGASAFAQGGDGYDTLSGTSQAAPFVTGVAALYLEQSPTLTPQQLTALLVRDAAPGRLHENLFHVFSGTLNLLLNAQQLA